MVNYCCVAGCHNAAFGNSGVKFFSFPVKHPAQRDLWIAAVRRQSNEDPSKPWRPSKWTRICSEHFLGGKWSRCWGHPSFTPTIFTAKHVLKFIFILLYRVVHLLGDLGWVYFVVPPSAQFCLGLWKFGRSGCAAGQDDGIPDPSLRADESPCSVAIDYKANKTITPNRQNLN